MTKQKKILIRCADDSVIVLSFVLDDGFFVKRAGTPQEIDAEIAKHFVAWDPARLPIKSWEEITDEDLPITRDYRNAWSNKGTGLPKGTKIEYDMPKARDIRRNVLRILRAPILQQLDIDYMKALELEDKAEIKKIADKKQRLRDITKDPRIDAAKTIEELNSIDLKNE